MRFYLTLTPRQREVVYWVCQGLSSRKVAGRMVIAPSVVAGHLTNIYQGLALFNGHVPQFHANRYTLIRLMSGFFEH